MIEITEYRYERNSVPELTRYVPLYDYKSEKDINEIREQLLALVYGWA
jgi:hypothetical protein